jgi:hypothetical protein
MALTLFVMAGPGEHLTAHLHDDNRYELYVAGSEIVEPPVEIGSYAGAAGAKEAMLKQMAQGALPGSPDVETMMPDTPYEYARSLEQDREIARTFVLYDLPPAWAKSHSMFFKLINGPWRASGKQRTVAGEAKWAASSIDDRTAPALTVRLSNTGALPLRLADPEDPERWGLVLIPETMSEEERERFEGGVAADQLHVEADEEPFNGYSWLDPGASLAVAIGVARTLAPGRYRALLRYHTSRVGRRAPGGSAELVEGLLTLVVDPLTVTESGGVERKT